MYRFRVIITLLLIAATTASCSRVHDVQKKPIRIAISIWPGYAYSFVAQEKGFFKKNGIEVELVFKKEYSDALDLYKNGQVDGTFEVFTDAVFHNSEGVPTKFVLVTDYSNNGDVIVARPDVKSILDLKEKPVGIEDINSFSHLFVLSVLTKAGLKEEDLRFEIVPSQQIPKALDEGRISAGHTWEPAKGEALKKGYKIIAKAGDIPGIITDGLSFSARITEKRPNDIRGIIRALFQAQDFIQTNRTEAVAIMAKAEGMSTEEMDNGLKGIIQPSLTQNKLIMKKGHNVPDSENLPCLFVTGKMIYYFYGNRGRFFSEKNLNDIVDPSFLE